MEGNAFFTPRSLFFYSTKDLLESFWRASASWVNYGAFSEMVSLQNQSTMIQADPQVVVFSDSALLTT
jgi:hypothetical protein